MIPSLAMTPRPITSLSRNVYKTSLKNGRLSGQRTLRRSPLVINVRLRKFRLGKYGNYQSFKNGKGTWDYGWIQCTSLVWRQRNGVSVLYAQLYQLQALEIFESSILRQTNRRAIKLYYDQENHLLLVDLKSSSHAQPITVPFSFIFVVSSTFPMQCKFLPPYLPN